MSERKAEAIDLGQLIETTTLSVQRALEARQIKKWPFGPITIGIIFYPPGDVLSQTGMAESKG